MKKQCRLSQGIDISVFVVAGILLAMAYAGFRNIKCGPVWSHDRHRMRWQWWQVLPIIRPADLSGNASSTFSNAAGASAGALIDT